MPSTATPDSLCALSFSEYYIHRQLDSKREPRTWSAPNNPYANFGLSAVLLDKQYREIDMVNFRHRRTDEGRIELKGDYDQCLYLDLRTLTSEIEHVVFVVCGYNGQDFRGLSNIGCSRTALKFSSGTKYTDIKPKRNSTAAVPAEICRITDGWAYKELRSLGRATSANEVVDLARQTLTPVR